jgi:hypothetical protein
MLHLVGLLNGLLGTVLTGMALTVVPSIPSFADRSMTLLSFATAGGFIFAAPITWFIARAILANGRKPA